MECMFINVPNTYRMNTTATSQTDVVLLEKFNDWRYEVNWWENPRQRLPYLASSSNIKKGLLSTATYTHNSGTIVASDSGGYVPARWITPQKESPGVIWYWINENDCDKDYKPSKRESQKIFRYSNTLFCFSKFHNISSISCMNELQIEH